MRSIQFQIFIIATVFVLLTAFLQTSPITTSNFVAGKLSESIYLVTDLSSLFFYPMHYYKFQTALLLMPLA